MALPEEKNLSECILQNLQPDLHPTMPSLGQEVANPSRELTLTITRVDQSRNKMITHVDQSRNNKNTAYNNFDLYDIEFYSFNYIDEACAKLESVNTPDNDHEMRNSSNNYENVGLPEKVSLSRSEDMKHQNNSHMKGILEQLLEDSSNGDMKNIYTAPLPVSLTHSDEQVAFDNLFQLGGNDLFDSDLTPSPSAIDTNPNDRSQNNQSMYADQNIKQHQYVPEYPNKELNHHDITLNHEIREDNNLSIIQYEQTPIYNLEIDHANYNMVNQQLKAPNEINKTCIPNTIVLPTSNDQIVIIVAEALDCIVLQEKPISMGVQSRTHEFSVTILPSASTKKNLMLPKHEITHPQVYQNDSPPSSNIVLSASNASSQCKSIPQVDPLHLEPSTSKHARRSRQSLEGMSDGEKNKHTRKLNKEAAQRHRNKTKKKKEELIQSKKNEEIKNQQLRAKKSRLELEIEHYKQLLDQFNIVPGLCPLTNNNNN